MTRTALAREIRWLRHMPPTVRLGYLAALTHFAHMRPSDFLALQRAAGL